MPKALSIVIKKLKIIVVVGPTASGKSELAVKLAKKLAPYRTEAQHQSNARCWTGPAPKRSFWCGGSGAGVNGAEIISADSRQVYRGLDIGTGKVPRDKIPKSSVLNSKSYCYKGVPHYLLDVANPKQRFTVSQYRKLALKAIDKIFKKGKIPILCGGTGFYIQAVLDGIIIPEVPPDWKLRKKLEKKSAKELFKILKKLDPRRAKVIEKENPRRLIRAIEIVKKTKKPVPLFKKNPLPYPILIIGVKKSPEQLKKLIEKRFLGWLKKGLINEVKNLKKMGLSWKRIREFGMEYPYLADYIQGKLSYQKMVELSQKEIEHYAKRQLTWFKRDKRIHWAKNFQEAENLTREFLYKERDAPYIERSAARY